MLHLWRKLGTQRSFQFYCLAVTRFTQRQQEIRMNRGVTSKKSQAWTQTHCVGNTRAPSRAAHQSTVPFPEHFIGQSSDHHCFGGEDDFADRRLKRVNLFCQTQNETTTRCSDWFCDHVGIRGLSTQQFRLETF